MAAIDFDRPWVVGLVDTLHATAAPMSAACFPLFTQATSP